MSSFGQILQEIGEFGLFQKYLLIALCIVSVFKGFDVFSQVFVGMKFPHHCNTDWILNHGPNLTYERQKNLTLPVGEDGKFESCKMFTPVNLSLETIEAFGINTTTECMTGWNYETRPGASSTVTEFDLVCDRSIWISASESSYMAGYLFGTLAFGAISDRFGRRIAILLSMLGYTMFGAVTGFSLHIYFYMAIKFFSGFTGGVAFMNISIMAVEWTSPSKTAVCTMCIMVVHPIGLMLLPAIAYGVHSWRVLQLVLFCPVILLVGLFFWFLPESARWLLTRGRKEEAQKLLERAARINKRKIQNDLLDNFELENTSKSGSFLDVFRTSYLRKRTILMGWNWFATTLMYYGLALNIGSFGLNIYLTQFIFGLVEIPAYLACLASTQYFGRRPSQAGYLLFGGAACLLFLVIPDDLPVFVTVTAVIGKFSSTAAFSTAYLYTAELYPTFIRHSGFGLNSMCGRVGGICSPLIRALGVHHHAIPMLIYGIIPLVAGSLTFLLPETLNVELQDHTDLK
ncbi:solute carrier family 22 member 13-like [Thalassophryne amazonica]|uniref:solute carrier family 22 member 13-like n=1 Tax=Thalassophryne amazonica TaxID=390379 RepID=UPI0014708D32|nr:solute carrier family 22 member 13-like [Thalassophryne amazonica]